MTDTSAQAAVREVIDARTTAMRTGDAAAICSGYAPDAVIFSLAPPLVQPPGSVTDVAAQQAWFDEKGGRVWADVRDVVITVEGDLAVATSLDSMGAPPESPQPFTLWFRTTLALRRTDDGWNIFHEHNSTPFYMDETGRAALDLQP